MPTRCQKTEFWYSASFENLAIGKWQKKVREKLLLFNSISRILLALASLLRTRCTMWGLNIMQSTYSLVCLLSNDKTRCSQTDILRLFRWGWKSVVHLCISFRLKPFKREESAQKEWSLTTKKSETIALQASHGKHRPKTLIECTQGRDCVGSAKLHHVHT